MAFLIGWAIKPLVWLTPAFFFLGMAGNRGDALQRERGAERQRLLLWSWMGVAVTVGVVKAATDNREIMEYVRWKRLLIRVLMLLGVGLNAVSCFIALDAVADMLLGDSSAAATSACAVVAIAAHIRLGWVAVVGA
jgi:hypothetical protein